MKTLQFGILISLSVLLSLTMLLFGDKIYTIHELVHITAMDKSDHFILFDVRLPRLIISLYCGMLFALAGNIFQVIYKNPVASPDILGVNAIAIFAILFFSNLLGTGYGLFIYSLIGALSGFILVIGLSRTKKRIDPVKMIVIGISISILFKALSQLIVVQSKESIHNILHFLNGSLYQVTWENVLSCTPMTIILVISSLLSARYLDVVSLSRETVKSLGVNLKACQIYFLAIGLLMSALAVSLSGSLGLIGLIAPNISRLMFGMTHRFNLLGSLLIGSILTLGSDLIGRVLFYPLEIPAGIIMIFIGTPVFLILLKKLNRYQYG